MEIVVISDGEDDGIAFVGMKQPRAVPSGPSRIPLLISSDSEDEPQDLIQLLQGDAKSSRLDRKGKRRAVERVDIATEIGVRQGGFSVERAQVEVTVRHSHSIVESIVNVTRSQFDDNDNTSHLTAPKPKRKSSGDPGVAGEKRKKSTATTEPASAAMPPPTQSKEEKDAIKAKEKLEKQLQRDAAKAAKEAEKSYQRKLTEVNKLRVSKNDAIREIHLYLSPDLELPSSPIAGALPEIRTRVVDNLSQIHVLDNDECSIPGVIKFKRHVTARWDSIKKQYIPLDTTRWQWESTLLLIVTAEDIVDKIAEGGLSTWAGDLRLALNLSPTDQIMLMIKGLAKYHSKTKSMVNKEFTAAARAGLTGASSNTTLASRPSREEVDTELVKLQVAERCFLVHVEKTEDIEDWVYNIAADVALRPYKLVNKSHLNFCPTDGIRKSGNPTETLELMLQEVQGVTPSAAIGIAAEYPTFRDLMEAFERAEKRGPSTADVILQDCEIKTLRDGTANGRKLNKALAKRVYNVFRGEDSLALA